ncbi:MAG: cytochrome c [Candidatus Latescibacterota bacterium]
MNRWWNLALLVALAGTVGLNLALRIDPERPNREFLPDMAHSPRADAFSPSAVLASGQTLQAPPPGTIPRGLLPVGFGPGPEEAQRAGRDLRSPSDPGAPAARSRGERVFAIFCQPCHGAGGAGDGPVARRGFPPPPSLLAPRALQMPDGQIFHVITFGQGNMPGYAAQVSREDRWNAVPYIRWLQRQAGPLQ